MPNSVPLPPPVNTLHGRRKGKKLRSFQSSLMQEVLPKLSVDISQPIAAPYALFADKPTELWLEIGFGGGEHLAANAAAHPQVGFFGCEPFENGIAKLLAQIDEIHLGNIRLLKDDAGRLLDALPPASLARVYILYPDPWPKRRQRKRRFISDAMLQRLARVMQPGAQLRFATDIDDYAGWVLQRVLRSDDFVWPVTNAQDWLVPWPNWPGTRYEQKALAAGRRPVYLTFTRNQAAKA